MLEPWTVEIYDFAGRLHEIEMQPGDIVYYESAKCLHGRMRPLRGARYSNIFVHYRPTGDPMWYTRENPAGAVEPLLHAPADDQPEPEAPHLSSYRPRLSRPNDLMDYWVHVSPPPPTSVAAAAAAASDIAQISDTNSAEMNIDSIRNDL